MKYKNCTKVFSVLYLLAMTFMLLPLATTAYAAEAYEPLKVEIPYKHIYNTTNTNVDSVFNYIITTKDDAPLPLEASETGSFSLDGVSGSRKENGDNTLFNLSGTLTFNFTKPGVYVYNLSADTLKNSKKTNASLYTFEPSTTTVTLYIENAPGNRLQMQMFTAENENDVKLKEIKLYSSYNEPLPTSSVNSTSTTTLTTSAASSKTTSASTKTASTSVPAKTSSTLPPFKTGDTNAVRQYAVLAVVSGAGIILPLVIGRKKGCGEDA